MPMAAPQTNIAQLISRFEQDINHYPYGYNEDNVETLLQSQLDILKKDIPVEAAAQFSKKVLWRLVNSLIRNTGRNPARARFCRNLLNNNIRFFRLDIGTKCTALNKMKKFGVNPGEKLEAYLSRKTDNDVVPAVKKSKVVYAPENYQALISEQMKGNDAALYAPKAFAYIAGLFKQNPDMEIPAFNRNVDLLLAVAEKSALDDKYIHFSSLYEFMRKKAQTHPKAVEGNLFEQTVAEPDTIQKDYVRNVARIYAKRLYQAKDMKNISRLCTMKFNNMMVAVVRKNSFTRNEVKDLAKELQSQPWTSRSVDAHVNRLGADLVDVFDKKQADEIKALNNWVYNNRKEDLLERQAVQDVYAAELYKKLIIGQDIGGDKFDNQYTAKKNLLKHDICALYGTADENGQPLDKNRAREQAINNRRQENQDKTDIIANYLNKKCRKCSFYGAVNAILKDFDLIRKPTFAPSLNSRCFPEFDR